MKEDEPCDRQGWTGETQGIDHGIGWGVIPQTAHLELPPVTGKEVTHHLGGFGAVVEQVIGDGPPRQTAEVEGVVDPPGGEG